MRHAISTYLISIPIATSSFAGSCAAEVVRTPAANTFMIGSFEIGRTTLHEIAAQLGPATERLEENGLVKKVCYTLLSTDGATSVLDFESTVIGGLSRITGFMLTSHAGDKACAPSRIRGDQVQPNCGVRLGMASDEFQRRLPLLYESAGRKLTYDLEATRTASDEEALALRKSSPDMSGRIEFDVTIRLEADFENDRLIMFYVSKIETL